jgi:hypothetical protein
MQWRNVISGDPRFKIFEGPLVEVLKARVKRRICTSFLGGTGHAHPENFWIYTLWNAISRTLGRDFTEFWWSKNDIVTYQRPWPMFLLYRLRLGAPIWPIEVGGPRVLPVWAHSSYATVFMVRAKIVKHFFGRVIKVVLDISMNISRFPQFVNWLIRGKF